MKSPTEAIDSLWKSKFFKEKKQTNEVSKKLKDEFEINPTNISDLLKKRKYLKHNKGWIQKYPAEIEGEISVHYFESEKPHTSRKNFVKILNELTGEIKICDPYLNNDTIEALGELKNAKVKFLTSSKPINIKISPQELKDFKIENKNIEIKGFPFDHLHDRYILCLDKLFLLGHGFSVRNKESFIIELPEKFAKDLIQSLNTTFDNRWRNQSNSNLC